MARFTKLPEHVRELVVVPGLEVVPREVGVARLRKVAGEAVAQAVRLEPFEVVREPHRVPAAGRELVALQVQEFVGGDVVGEDVVLAVRVQHRGEEQRR